MLFVADQHQILLRLQFLEFAATELLLDPREDRAYDIANWLEVLKNDNRAIFTAASQARRAANSLNSLQPAGG